ncbi:disulfide bond formation protein DsbC [Frateuria sp. Soil773]|uniref:thioredoxin fold domain-containing protein n=1 Tax=Frateuria sp. Soil773 TaxID=1736407 RepID=UPI0006F41C44|nr:thioredoxin fold domain-containing protein [Frateuria sp. Soil773]KRE88682.1 disulfide bond formation protein DsbC [Frateuria sp. Soil773]
MLKKLLLAVVASGFALGACAADEGGAANANAEQLVRKAVKSLSAQVEIDSVTPARLPGFYQVIASGHLVYVSADGKYMLNGDLIDLGSKSNLSEAAWAGFRKAELAKVPAAQRIVFAPANPKYTVTVFTDVNCGYCRALHEHIAEFNKEGIAVEYLAWPREGVTTTAGNETPTYKEMVSVWCAADRKAAFTAAKEGKAPKPASCANPVKDQFDLGLKLGVNGTPTIIGSDGMVLGGYVPPDKLLKMVQKTAASGG